MILLPRRSWRRDNFFDAHVLDALAEEFAVDAVAITNQKAWRSIIGKRFDDLLGRPARSWVSRDDEVDYHAAIVLEHDEAK